MDIDDDIKRALQKAIDKAGTQMLLSKSCGVRRNCFSKYLRGEVKVIEHKNWKKLIPYLNEFLPDNKKERLIPSDCEDLCARMSNMDKGFMKDYVDLDSDEKKEMWSKIEDMKAVRLKNKAV